MLYSSTRGGEDTMQAITVLVMVDPTAPQCIINPRILESIWLEDIDCGPGLQVVIANMRMQPGSSAERATPLHAMAGTSLSSSKSALKPITTSF